MRHLQLNKLCDKCRDDIETNRVFYDLAQNLSHQSDTHFVTKQQDNSDPSAAKSAKVDIVTYHVKKNVNVVCASISTTLHVHINNVVSKWVKDVLVCDRFSKTNSSDKLGMYGKIATNLLKFARRQRNCGTGGTLMRMMTDGCT